MYSYQHRYHAGSFSDIHKHVVLLACLAHFHRKDAPFCVLDAFAGEGVYDLQCAEAQKIKEFTTGFDKLLQAESPPQLVRRFLDIAFSLDPTGHLYPGSSFLIQTALRQHDRALLVENHPQASHILKQNLKGYAGVHIHKREAYEAIQALLPFKEKRGLLFLDPSYEVKAEYLQLAKAVRNILQKAPNVVIMIWYPILSVDYHQKLLQSLQTLDNTLRSELLLQQPLPQGITGSGIFIINPPWQLDTELAPVLDFLRMQLLCK